MAAFIAITLVLATVISYAQADCHTYFAVHEIISAPNQVLAFDDEGGFREVKAKSYNVGKCGRHPKFLTGQQYIGNYTLMGHQASVKNDQCLVKRVGGELIYDSMQALIIRTNGWTIQPQSIDLDDLDAQAKVRSEDGWKESMAIFGLFEGSLVKPDLKFAEKTLLGEKQYKVPAAAMKEMELQVGDSYVPGGEYVSEEMINCPFGRDNIKSKKCRMTATFSGPLDTLVLLYAVSQKSKTDPNAAVFFSEVTIKCGCRCKQMDVGTRKMTGGVPGVANECVETEMSSLKTQCDILGDKWCSKQDMVGYKVTGNELSNGNVPCEEIKGDRIIVTEDFKPQDDFLPNNV